MFHGMALFNQRHAFTRSRKRVQLEVAFLPEIPRGAMCKVWRMIQVNGSSSAPDTARHCVITTLSGRKKHSSARGNSFFGTSEKAKPSSQKSQNS